MPRTSLLAFLALVLARASILTSLAPASDGRFEPLAEQFANEIRPLVERYCVECHAGETPEGDLDLSAFQSLADVRTVPRTWQKVLEMLESGQMPPKDATQPDEPQRMRLRQWVGDYLKVEAAALAGDPGHVPLRRLTSAEYTYAIRDLTRVAALSPAEEFPVDAAAGEGFTNSGSAQVMSSSLLTKYLDAAKEVASHAVLLPDGVRFSPATTRRDWTEEVLVEIRQLYATYSDSQGGSQVNLQGIVFETNGGGRLPVERYFEALLTNRDALVAGATTIDAVARDHGLSPKYLGTLWRELQGSDANDGTETDSLLIDRLRTGWQTATAADAPALAAYVAQWHQSLWRFSSIGHIGKLGGPKAWQEPVTPLVARQELRLELPAPTDRGDIVLYLAARDAGDGNENDYLVWERPRLVVPGRDDLLLRDLRRVTSELVARRQRIHKTAEPCLAAAADASVSEQVVPFEQLAEKHQVDHDSLAAWLEYLGIGSGGTQLGTPLTRTVTSTAGYDFIQGWVGDDALSVVANSSDQHVRIPGNMQPHSVAVHPSPTLAVAVAWRSPVFTALDIKGLVTHAHPECGDGVQWTLELRRGGTRTRLASGTAQGANGVAVGPLEKVAMQVGDVVALVIDARHGNHSCDLTTIDLTLADGTHTWNLAADVSPDILAANPHDDRQGNAAVWHFFSQPAEGSGSSIPTGSLLARWQTAANVDEKQRLAGEIARLLEAGPSSLPPDAPDATLYRQLTSLNGPLCRAAWHAPDGTPAEGAIDEKFATIGLDAAAFGKHPDGSPIEPASLCVRAPSVIEVRLPADMVEGCEFVVAGALHSDTGAEGTVQAQVLTEKPNQEHGLVASKVTETAGQGPWTSNDPRIAYTVPIIATEGSDARRQIEAALEEFRQLFPAALCYSKIVPVDEVITLSLFHREDEPLRRLMLDEPETARLERLWDELHFISQDAFLRVDAFEQLWQYATQDADPKVFEPLRQPILDRAAEFRQQLLDAEPRHVEAVLKLASRAFRRPLEPNEIDDLRQLYRTLRDEQLSHEEAIRLLIARVLVAPAFLYRGEKGRGQDAHDSQRSDQIAVYAARPVSDLELATRLSFFLWSTLPDDELRATAERGQLRDEETLVSQARRMLRDPRMRRLATEFGCQWLHIYDFDSHDEKSEAAFPTFLGLREAMYEESIRFLADLFGRDGSVLEVLDADHTFLNEDLARHYGIPDVTGSPWRRVDGVKRFGRGGILGLASTLSKQSGASRSSPILRGNWVCEVLLGEKLPKPPAGIPQIPDVVPAGLTERQLIEMHSSVESCAKCHARIDPLGFALEAFDGIGRTRPLIPGLPLIDTRATLADGTRLDGLEGLRSYLLTTRREDFVRQFCRKLLGYALGRETQLSDEPLLDDMQARLAANGFRVSIAVEMIVRSAQFRMARTIGNELADAPAQVRPTE